MKSRVEPGEVTGWRTVTCCQAVVSVTCAVVVATSVEPTYSRNLSLSDLPPASARTHRLPVYTPDDVVATQLGESLRRHVAFVVPPFVTWAAQPPVCPPATLVSVTPVPEPEVFQPLRLVSKPGLPTKLTVSEAVPVLPLFVPVTVCAPAELAVQVAPVQEPFGHRAKLLASCEEPQHEVVVFGPRRVAVTEATQHVAP